MRDTPAQRTARYRARHPEKIAAYKQSEANKISNAKYRAKHGPHPMNTLGTKPYAKYRASEKYLHSSINGQLKRAYGISYEDYKRMLVEQGGVCKICGKHNTLKISKRRELRPLFVDHCHKTSKIRGLLCIKCNFAIGAFEENDETLKKAIRYLKESQNF